MTPEEAMSATMYEKLEDIPLGHHKLNDIIYVNEKFRFYQLTSIGEKQVWMERNRWFEEKWENVQSKR